VCKAAASSITLQAWSSETQAPSEHNPAIEKNGVVVRRVMEGAIEIVAAPNSFR
jgi:hypothetical protein